MLGHTYRIQAYNGTGVTVTITVDMRPWKLDSAGALVYAAEATPISAASVTTATYSTASTVDNSTALNIGADITATFAPGSSATGTVTVYLQRSTDGGTTWPSDGLGEWVGSHTFAASATSINRNFTIE